MELELFSEKKVHSVTGITRYIAGLFASDPELTSVSVRGEISNFVNHASGHFYFSVKDDGAILKCVMFRNSNRFMKFMPQNGMAVVVKGYIGTYPQRGEYQMYAQSMEREGTGELYKKFLELRDRLKAEGLFDDSKKRPIPDLPRRVGVVTSPEGSVVCDIINVVRRRFANMPILIAPATVQGASAAPSICEALRSIAAAPDVDVVILARGGGSFEELWPFNEESVARAIVACPRPVISAVGHQTDFTISDFVADLRAPTPSAAAELAVADRQERFAFLDGLAERARFLVESAFAVAKAALADAGARLSAHSPERRFENVGMHLDGIEMRMRALLAERAGRAAAKLAGMSPAGHLAAIRARLAHRGETLGTAGKRLGAVIGERAAASRDRLERLRLALAAFDCRSLLERGYSILRDAASGRIVSRLAQAPPGAKLAARLSDGEIEVVCSGVLATRDPIENISTER